MPLTRYSFRLACMKIPFSSWEFATEKKIDNLLWDIHTKVVSLYRTVLRKLPSEMRVRKRNTEKCYREFISTARLFYKTYIQNLSKWYPIERLHRIAGKLHLPRGSGDGNISPEQESQILHSVQQTLSCLGDLSRYQNQVRPNDRDIQSAIDYYSLAHDMQPDNGHALHQIGVTHLGTDQHLDALYYFYLSMARATPHSMAEKNLDKLFGELSKGLSFSGTQNRIQILGGRAVQLHARYMANEAFPARKELEQTVLQQLKEILKRTDSDKLRWDKLPVKLAVVNMGAYYYAATNRQGTVSVSFFPHENRRGAYQNAYSTASTLASTYTFAFNLLFLESICKLLCDHIEQAQGLMPGEASGKENKVAPGMAAAISALRLYCCWISSHGPQLAQADAAASELAHMVRNMWVAFAKAAEMIVDYFRSSVVELSTRTGQHLLVTAPYLLEEDEEAAGYLALGDPRSEVYCRLFCRQGHDGRPGDHKPTALESDVDELASLDALICRVGDIMWSIRHFSVNEIYPLQSRSDESGTFQMEYGYGLGSPRQPQGAQSFSQQQAGDTSIRHTVNGGVDGAGAYRQAFENGEDDSLEDAQLHNVQQIYRTLEGVSAPEAAIPRVKLKGKSKLEEPAIALTSYCTPLPWEWFYEPWTLSMAWQSLPQIAFLEIPNILLPRQAQPPPSQPVQRSQPSRPSRPSQPQSSRSHHLATSTDDDLDQQRQALLRMLKDSDLITKSKGQPELSAAQSSTSTDWAAPSQSAQAQPNNPPQRTLYRPGQGTRGDSQNHAGHGHNGGRPQSSYGVHSGRGGSGRGHNRNSSYGQSGPPGQQGSSQGSQQRQGHRYRTSREGNSFRGGRGGGNRSDTVILAHRSRPSG